MITPQLVKELRDRTFAGFGDCKAALEEAQGDLELAIEILRKKGIAKSAKRAENETKEGKIQILVEGGNAYVASVSCETDFVARNDVFAEMVDKIVATLKTHPSDADALVAAEAVKGDYAIKMGENIRILALTKISGEMAAAYVHSTGKVAAVVTARAGTDAEKLRQIAMHVTATSPEVLSPSDVSDELVAKEKEIALAQMAEDPKNAGKPKEILEKIIEGKMSKFKEENALLTQQFVVDPSLKVEDVVGKGMLTGFKRFAI